MIYIKNEIYERIMGIHNFVGWIKKEHYDIYSYEEQIDVFYFDLTYMLYICFYGSLNIDDVIKKISSIIIHKIEKYSPNEIVVAMDGIPCLSKIKTECIRRKNMKEFKKFDTYLFTPCTQSSKIIKKNLSDLMNDIIISFIKSLKFFLIIFEDWVQGVNK